MTTDARIQTSLPSHPKTKKLVRKLGADGAWKLVCLFLWAAGNRSDGDLSGMSADDIELAIDWSGDEGAFVGALIDVGFLDSVDGVFSIHDWDTHNPWASGSSARSEKARWAALCKLHGRPEAARLMPDYANRTLGAVPDSATSTPLAESRSAPSPSPSPLQDQEIPPNKLADLSSVKKTKDKNAPISLKAWIESLNGEDAIPEEDPVFAYADSIRLPDDYIALAWSWFKDAMATKRQKDWRAHFRNAVKGNWPKYWWPTDDGGWRLSPAGEQAKRAAEAKAA